MRIYNQELQDGITALQNTTRAECVIRSSSDFSGELTDELAKTIAKYVPSNPNQIDLHYLTCILVSLGWNKNDDVFGKEELWGAKQTPKDKPFNFMHDESDIIGHMTGSVVLDSSGTALADSILFEEVPDAIDIAVSAVIYKSWSDIEQLVRIREIVQEIEAGEWAVSMECLFRSFDYALITPEGEHKILARSEESAFLTKHLRAYGGSGEFEGVKVGRLLRNISFSGIGLVSRPANPRSLILNTENSLGEFAMADTAKTAAEEVDSKVAALETELATATQTVEDLKTSHAATVTEKDAKITELETSLAASQEEVKTAKAEVDSIVQQLKAMQDKVRCMERRSLLTAMKLDSETVEELVETLKEMDDTAFSAAVSLAKRMRPSYAEEVDTVEDEETTEADETEEVVDEIVEADEVEETSLNDAGDDVNAAAAQARASISDWFAKSVLTTTRKLQ